MTVRSSSGRRKVSLSGGGTGFLLAPCPNERGMGFSRPGKRLERRRNYSDCSICPIVSRVYFPCSMYRAVLKMYCLPKRLPANPSPLAKSFAPLYKGRQSDYRLLRLALLRVLLSSSSLFLCYNRLPSSPFVYDEWRKSCLFPLPCPSLLSPSLHLTHPASPP